MKKVSFQCPRIYEHFVYATKIKWTPSGLLCKLTNGEKKKIPYSRLVRVTESIVVGSEQQEVICIFYEKKTVNSRVNNLPARMTKTEYGDTVVVTIEEENGRKYHYPSTRIEVLNYG